MIFLVVKKNKKSSARFREKLMFLNLAYCLILTFSQWLLVNLAVEIYSKMPNIM